ncbi:MAG: prepilin-type N-terminal cleavage/methylation domain-containing protein, partial [Bacteroidota bacterium]
MRRMRNIAEKIGARRSLRHMGRARLKAFTLLEMMVVLALSGIVVAVAWGVFSNFNLFGLEFRKRNHDTFHLLQMDQFLRADALRATNIQGDSLRFSFQDRNARTFATYTRTSKALVRTFSA